MSAKRSYSYGGPFIHNEAAYEDATRERIRENARKGKAARWYAEDESRKALMARIGVAAEKGDKFMRAMWDASEEWGALSEKQEAAVRASFARADERIAAAKARDAGSVHVGVVGKRQDWTLTVRNVVFFEETDWSAAYRIVIMNDEAGNVLVYKGNSLKMDVEAERASEQTRRPVKGETVTITATVKAHSERDGVAQTVLARPKLKAVS